MSQDKDPKRYVREYVREGRVPDAANDARFFVEREPDNAAKAEREAMRGHSERWVTVDELVAKGHSVIERVRPMVERAVGNLRARLGRK